MAEGDRLKDPLYHDAGRLTFVAKPRLLSVGRGWIQSVERCGIGGCDRRATYVAKAFLDGKTPGEVRICAYHATPLDELPES